VARRNSHGRVGREACKLRLGPPPGFTAGAPRSLLATRTSASHRDGDYHRQHETSNDGQRKSRKHDETGPDARAVLWRRGIGIPHVATGNEGTADEQASPTGPANCPCRTHATRGNVTFAVTGNTAQRFMKTTSLRSRQSTRVELLRSIDSGRASTVAEVALLDVPVSAGKRSRAPPPALGDDQVHVGLVDNCSVGSHCAPRQFRRGARLLTGSLGALVLAGCALTGPPTGTGDPGNMRLRAIAADRILHVLPPHSTRTAAFATTPAAWDSDYRYWSAPTATSYFTSRSTVRSVFQFYAKLASTDGWTPSLKNSLGLVRTWHKTQPGGYLVDLDLNVAGRPQSSAQVDAEPYNLSEDANPIAKS
jgi:hypothetical protein